MRATERRLLALETAFNVKPPRPVRRVIVRLGETVAGVLAREGIGPDDNVIVRVIVDPKPRLLDG